MNPHDWIAHAARLQAEQRAFALVTVLRTQAPTSAKPGDKAIVTADGHIHGWIGGGCAQPAVVKTVRHTLETGQPQSIRITPTDETEERTLGDVLEFGMACHSGGTLELFIDPVLPAAHLTVFGESPVARALVGLAQRVGMRVALVSEGVQAADFPEAAQVISSDHAETVAQHLAAGGLAVVATQGRRDLQALKAALASRPQTLWFVASERKATVLRQTLLAAGENQAAVAAIVAPAGEPIGAQTPEEIALSVLAAVVAARRGRTGVSKLAPPVAVPAAKTAMDLTPMEMGSCCGGPAAAVVEPTPALAVVEPATAAQPRKSCCGGS